MKIALFNSFPFHYEVFGFLLEFLQKCANPPNVYTNSARELGWFELYKTRFSLEPKPIESFDHTVYDMVFLLTDDDFTYKLEWTHPKLIILEHCAKRFIDRPVFARLQIRQFFTRVPPSSPDTWIMPVWDLKPIVKNNIRTRVVCLGNNFPVYTYELMDMFPNFEDIDFTYINRKDPWIPYNNSIWDDYDNVTIIEECSTDNMLNIARSADWLLLAPRNPDHMAISLSAIVPLAYSIGTPMLMTEAWADAHKLRGIGVLKFQDISKPTPALLSEFNAERKTLFARRNKILSSITGISSGIVTEIVEK
jgi:hypothetical protein